MRNPIIEKLEKDELKLIKKGEYTSAISLIIAVLSGIASHTTALDFRLITYISGLICVVGAGYTLYLRFALGNWKR